MLICSWNTYITGTHSKMDWPRFAERLKIWHEALDRAQPGLAREQFDGLAHLRDGNAEYGYPPPISGTVLILRVESEKDGNKYMYVVVGS